MLAGVAMMRIKVKVGVVSQIDRAGLIAARFIQLESERSARLREAAALEQALSKSALGVRAGLSTLPRP